MRKHSVAAPRRKGAVSLPKVPQRLKRTAFHHGDLRNAVMDVALRLMEQRRGPYFTLREIAKLVGVKHPAVYRHFADKTELLVELATRGYELLMNSQIQAYAQAQPDPLQQLRATARSYIQFAIDHPGFYRLISDLTLHDLPEDPTMLAVQERAWNRMLKQVSDCQSCGLLVDGNPALLAGVMWASRDGMAQLLVKRDTKWALDAGLSEAELIDAAVEAGIRAFLKAS